jgi:hypothetical protein
MQVPTLSESETTETAQDNLVREITLKKRFRVRLLQPRRLSDVETGGSGAPSN